MRLTLALLTSAILATTASAQSITPDFQTRGSVAAYAPVVAIAPEIATAAPSAAQRVDRTEISTTTAVTPDVVPGPAQGQTSRTKAPSEERLQPVRKASAESRRETTRNEPRRAVDRSASQSSYRAAPVTSGTRNLGRFWPPVF